MEGEKGGFVEQLLKKASDTAMTSMPKCEICGAHLMAGAGTFSIRNRGPMVICSRCVIEAVDYWVEHREERLNLKG